MKSMAPNPTKIQSQGGGWHKHITKLSRRDSSTMPKMQQNAISVEVSSIRNLEMIGPGRPITDRSLRMTTEEAERIIGTGTMMY